MGAGVGFEDRVSWSKSFRLGLGVTECELLCRVELHAAKESRRMSHSATFLV